MFGFNAASGSAVLTALNRSLAIIEFDQKGTILTANENFCNAMGYSLSEIKGQHHSMFVDPDYVRSPDYKAFCVLRPGFETSGCACLGGQG